MATTRTPALLLLAAASALVLTSCTSTDGPAPAPDIAVTATGDAAPPADNGGAATSTYETAIAAVTTAEAEAGGRAYELDREDDGSWEVHVAAGDREVEVRIDADAATVISSRDDDGLDDDDRAGLDSAVITLADAIRTAATANGSGSGVDDASLEDEDGRWAWEVSFDDGPDVHVSVTDGAIVERD